MPLIYIGTTSSQDYLAHHGILGQKWGVRRFQNPDGSLTAEGRERYSSDREQKELAKTVLRSNGKFYSSKSEYNKIMEQPQIKSAVQAVKGLVKKRDKAEAEWSDVMDEFYNGPKYKDYAIKAANATFKDGVRRGWWNNSKETLDGIIWDYLYGDGDQGDIIESYIRDNPSYGKRYNLKKANFDKLEKEADDFTKEYVRELVGEYGDKHFRDGLMTSSNVSSVLTFLINEAASERGMRTRNQVLK